MFWSKLHRPLASVLLVATCAMSTAPALAQPKAPQAAKAPKRKSLGETLTGDAKAAFDRGVTLYERQNFEGALAEFERAFTLSKDPRLLFNMAIAERDLKRYARAMARLSQELADTSGLLSDADRSTARALLEGLKPYTAPLTVAVNEPGATVSVDGFDVGSTPLATPVQVDVGERTIVVKKAGFLDASRKVSISGGTPARLDVTLDPAEKRGKLVVRAIGPQPALVFVDGIERGPTPWEGEVAAGVRHTIELRSRGFVTETRTEAVEARSTSVIELTLRPDQGKVRVESDRPENTITIDGKIMGSGTWEGTLPSGSHQLVVTRDGAEPYDADLNVQTDQSRTVKITLRGKGGVGWYWWVAGAVGVAAVAGGVAYAVSNDKKTQDAPRGTIDPGLIRINFGR